MAQTVSALYTHIIFSTKNRTQLITTGIQERLWRYLGGICSDLNCTPIQIGGSADHIHILCILSREVALSDLVRKLKSHSTVWVKATFHEAYDFCWQRGYGAFSVNPQEKDTVIEYIVHQQEHHKNRSFQDELLVFLKKYGVTYDEKYLWSD